MILVPCPFWRVLFCSSNNACLIDLIFSSSFFDNVIAGWFLSKSTCHCSFIDLTISSPLLNFCWIWRSRNLRLLWYSCAQVVTGPMSNIASSSFVLSLKGFVLLDHSSWLFWLVDCLPPLSPWLLPQRLPWLPLQMILFPSWWWMTGFKLSLSHFQDWQEILIVFSLCWSYAFQ